MEQSSMPAMAAMIRALCCSKNSGLSSGAPTDAGPGSVLAASDVDDRLSRDAVRLPDSGELLAAS